VGERVRDLLVSAERRLKRSPAIDHWPVGRDKDDARVLLAQVLGRDEEDLDVKEVVSPAAARRYSTLVRRRAGGEPIPQILGWMEFGGLRLRVRPGVFVPRQSSEFLLEQALRRLARRRLPVAVDLATGIGPIALGIASRLPRAEVHGTDLSRDATREARANASALGLRNAWFHTGDLLGSVPRRLRGRVDVITLHPPYVPRGEVEDLPLEVRGFEPKHTLTDGSPHGLGLAERATEEAPAWLRPGGWLLLEVSPDRARLVRGLLSRAGYRDVRSTKGWPEVTRVVVGRR
jgi:release factor glutamine methyltransferase